MANFNFDTSNDTLRKLCGNGMLYKVPMFQRDYSWSEEEWDDLWNDIVGLFGEEGEPFHYMGYLVLQSGDSKNFGVIDGQQRITTISLIILSIIKQIEDIASRGHESEDNIKRADKFRTTYIGDMDPVSLVSQTKLKLNRNNDDFYQNYIVPFQKMPQRGLKKSEKLLKNAFEWFCKKASAYFSDKQDGKECAKFIDVLADKLVFTVIEVTDELNAFKVFETLNARGVRLSSTDLLKNYLFSVVHNQGSHSTEIENLEKLWNKISDKLEGEDFPTFLRYYWNSYNVLARKNELFKVIRKNIQTKAQVFDLVRNIDRYADIYIALKRPEDELWSNDERGSLKVIKTFGVKQPFSMLMACHSKLEKSIFSRLLKAVSVISFRYNIIGNLNANEMEKVYNKAACTISSDDKVDYNDILKVLKPIYVNDDAFKGAFANASIRMTTKNKKLIRYVLFSLERHISHAEYDFESEKYNIEHIYPENPSEEYEGDFDEQYLTRIGNYTMMSVAENRDAGNKLFKDKKSFYEKSIFHHTKKIAEEFSEWNENSIKSRQEWMAKQAKTIWKINAL